MYRVTSCSVKLNRDSKQMGDIGTRPGDEVIDAQHVPALLDEAVAEVGTQESCSASDHDAQCMSFRLLRLRNRYYPRKLRIDEAFEFTVRLICIYPGARACGRGARYSSSFRPAQGRRAMKVPVLDLKAEYAQLRDEILPALDRVCTKSSFVLGQEVEAFEREFADFCGTKHCVALSSGTAALHLGLLALGVQADHEVITTPNSFLRYGRGYQLLRSRAGFRRYRSGQWKPGSAVDRASDHAAHTSDPSSPRLRSPR